MAKKRKEDQIFIQKPFKHFRRSYSSAEFGWGIAVFFVLSGILGWVIYRGAHPEPGLFADGSKFLQRSRVRKVYQRPLVRQGGPPPRRAADVTRALFPKAIHAGGWSRKGSAVFTPKNLYEKINGREGYFKSFGFRRLYFTTLVHGQSSRTIDLEGYDLTNSANALGAYAGELGAKARPVVGPKGMYHISRNALFVSRGQYYLRIIGSDESVATINKLKALRDFFAKSIPGAALPWGYGFLIAHMALKASDISYLKENAFSFDFAKDVYAATFDKSAKLFLNARSSPADAKQQAARFRKGFLTYGARVSKEGIIWIKDNYISTYATALAEDRFVLGIQGASSLKKAKEMLSRLRQAVQKMPETLRKQAQPAQSSPRTRPPAPKARGSKGEPSYGTPGKARPPTRRSQYQGGEPNYGNPTPRARRAPARRSQYQGGEPNYGNPTPRRRPAARRRGQYQGGEPNYGNPRPAARSTKAPARRRGQYQGGEPNYGNPAPRRRPAARRRGQYQGGEPSYGNPAPRRPRRRPAPARRRGQYQGGEPNYGNPPPRRKAAPQKKSAPPKAAPRKPSPARPRPTSRNVKKRSPQEASR